MLKTILYLAFSVVMLPAIAESAECEPGWIPYKDEHCIKAFSNLLSYNEANNFCTSQGNDMSKSSLVMVKEQDIQMLLANYTTEIYDNLWLGSRYNIEMEQFFWEDGEPLTYSNWQDGYPRNHTDTDACIELRPVNAKMIVNADGKWADVNCEKRNLVMCQKVLSWTLQDAIGEIIRIRKELETTQQELAATQQELVTTRHEFRLDLESVSSRVIPVGSIYIEYFNQPSPSTLWPTLSWQDVSSTYAGLFFRTSGGGSAEWGTSQTECAPRISQVNYQESADGLPTTTNIPTNGWSPFGRIGRWYGPGSGAWEGVRFNVAGCEVRPRNQAIRIWKRTT